MVGVALVVVALNLRLPITSVPPIVEEIRTGLGLSNAAVGMVTTLPLICFGIAAFGASRLARRWGDELVILGSLGLLIAGTLLRLVTEVSTFFAGTLLLGAGIALMNVLVASVVKRHYAHVGRMTGIYVVAMLIGAGTAAGISVPLAEALGGWDVALAVWAVPAAIAVVAWLPLVRAAGRPEVTAVPVARVRLGRDKEAWLLAGFLSCQTFVSFAIIAWVPEILVDDGLSASAAGAMAAMFLLVGIPSALLMPLCTARLAVFATFFPWCIGLGGLLIAPGDGVLAWMTATGWAQGGGFAVALTLIVVRARNDAHAASLSGMVQGISYLIGACSPPLIGLLHDLTHGWTVSLTVMLLISIAQFAIGLAVTSSPAPAEKAARAAAEPLSL